MNRISIETYQIDGIPVLTMAREHAERCPLVIYAHSFAADRKQGLSMGYELARSGFFFLSFDAPMFGDRPDERLSSLVKGRGPFVFPPESGLDVFFLVHEIVVQTAREIEGLIIHLDQDNRVDASKIGLSGFSMGGFTTFYTAATNPRIQAAVPMGAVPAFAARWADVVLETCAYLQWAEAMAAVPDETARRAAFMDEIDPFDRLRTFAPKPLLMITGDKDTDAPKKYLVDLYRSLQPLYAACPERLRLSIHDEVGHDFTRPMIEQACEWFRRFLKD